MNLRPILTGVMTLLSVSALQAADDTANVNDYFGVRVSYERVCPGDVDLGNGTKVDLFQNGNGVSFGGIYHRPIYRNLYVEPAVMFAYNTFGVKSASGPGLPIDAAKGTVKTWHVRVPINFGYRFDVSDNFGISIFTGPELALGLYAKEFIPHAGGDYKVELYNNDGKGLNRPDIKWRAGVGFIVSKHFEISASGAFGLCDQLDGDQKMHNNIISVTLGYNF